MTDQQPLVSLLIISYNQERFIGPAVRSALAQTYEPLEIIMSDDFSSDRTFEFMKAEADAYHGPHKVLLNKNQSNCGLAMNLNKAASLATGTLLILQAGDDISLPDRTTKLVRASREPTQVDMVCSNVSLIDKDGNTLPELRREHIVTPLTIEAAVDKGSISALGCACAYSRSLFTKYGPIEADVLQEDCVMPFRALLERGIRVVNEPLVKYRLHGDNLFVGTRSNKTVARPRDQERRWAKSWLAIAKDWSNSWAFSGRHDPDIEHKLILNCRRRQYNVDCYGYSRAHAALAALCGLSNGLTLRNAAGLIKRHVLR